MKQAIRSLLAEQDIQDALDFHLAESPSAALGFLDALERATRHIEKHPASGSPRYAHELNIPALRFHALRRYPYALFYVEHGDHLDVIRCTHLNRDIPPVLRGDV